MVKYYKALEDANNTPISADSRNYQSMFDGILEGYISAKDAFNFMLMANYETMAGKKRDSKSAKLFCDMFFYDMCDYPFIVVKSAFDRWRRGNNWLPTVADIIKLIEGVECHYLADDYKERYVESSKKIVSKSLNRLRKEIDERNIQIKVEERKTENIAISDKTKDIVKMLTNNMKGET